MPLTVEPRRPRLEENMNKRLCIAITALALGVALSSASAFAQNGPSALNYGAGSGPLSGGQPYNAQPAAKGQTVAPQSGGPAGPAGANFGAGSNPLTGGQAYNAQPAASGRPVYDTVTPPASSSSGPAGPGGANYGAGSNPLTGR
jgi:hypothetical protein